jgi:hypothetical protein
LLRPTIFGYLADKIREIRIEAKRMILAGFYENAAVNCLITIAIMLNYGKDLKKKTRFNDDDLIDYVITFEKYIDNIDNRDWEAENKIPNGTLNKIIAGRDQLIKDMLTLGINPWFAEVKLSALKDSEFINECVKIQKCIQSGFKQQTFYYLAGKFTNEKIMVHAQKDAQKIIAGNIIYIDNHFSVDSISLVE